LNSRFHGAQRRPCRATSPRFLPLFLLTFLVCFGSTAARAQNPAAPPPTPTARDAANAPAALANAQQQSRSKRPIAAVKVMGEPPKIDGDVSDAAWKTAAKAEVFVDPRTGAVAADQTIVYLLYDDAYIYVAFDCQDKDPTGVTGRETVRDSRYQGQGGDSEDGVEVRFDPFLSFRGQDFSRFSVNPLGTRSARLGGGRAGKAEWKGEWDAGARRTATGWTAEMRIPWAILNYPTGRSGATLSMGINFLRYQYRTRLGTIWSDVGPQGFDEQEGRWEQVAVPKSAFRPQLSLLPYLLPGGAFGKKGDNRNDDPNAEVRTGLDARYTITPELTVVGTLNPDFATIEGAVEGIGFSRSERFIPERRPFFLEGGNYFNAGDFFALGPYFYSNRIPGFDVGAKAFGKLGPRDTFGLLMTMDVGDRMDIVARLRRDLSPTRQVGFFLTQKTARPGVRGPDDLGDDNTVGVLLGGDRWGKVGFNSQLALSAGRDAGGAAGQLNFTYSDSNNFTSFQYKDVAPHFRDANGLIFFTDYRGISLYHNWSREWRGATEQARASHRGFRGFDVNFSPQITWHYDGRPFQRGANVSVNFETRSDIGLGFNANYNKFNDQTDATGGFFIGLGQSNRFRRFGLNVNAGKQADKPYRFYGPSASLRVLGHLDLIYQGGLQTLDNERTTQHVLTMNYELSPTRSFGGRVVQENNRTNWYLSFRNSGAAGTEMFLLLGDPNADQFARRAALKFVFAL